MPTYDGTAIGGGKERPINIVTMPGKSWPVRASCEIPTNDSGTKTTTLGASGRTEKIALTNLVDDNSKYKIRVGKKSSDQPRLDKVVW